MQKYKNISAYFISYGRFSFWGFCLGGVQATLEWCVAWIWLWVELNISGFQKRIGTLHLATQNGGQCQCTQFVFLRLVFKQCPLVFNSKLLPLSLPTLLFKISCPHTCFNRNYPFRSGTYPFFWQILPRFSIVFIFNPFPPLVSSLPITWFNTLLNQVFCFQRTSLLEAKALSFPSLK